MGQDAMIACKGLTKCYRQVHAVRDLSFEVREGEIFGFLGPNGAGKSTTLLMLLGLSEPTSGVAKVCGLDPLHHSLTVKRMVGYLPENVGFYGDLTPVESLDYVADLNGLPLAETRERIEDILRLVGLHNDMGKKVSAFSRGMRQRLGIAEVLLKAPKILFLDEPTIGLDPDGAYRLIDLINALNKERGITVLLSSHNLHQVQRIAHRVGIMIQGSMVAQGPISELSNEKFGVGEKVYSLEEVYMKYFQEV